MHWTGSKLPRGSHFVPGVVGDATAEERAHSSKQQEGVVVFDITDPYCAQILRAIETPNLSVAQFRQMQSAGKNIGDGLSVN